MNNCKQSIVFTNIWVAYCSPFCVAFLLFSLIVFCFQLISGINLKNTTDTLFFFKDETYRYIFQCLDKTKLSEAVASRLQRCQRWINGCLAASLPDLQMRILYWRPLLSLSITHSLFRAVWPIQLQVYKKYIISLCCSPIRYSFEFCPCSWASELKDIFRFLVQDPSLACYDEILQTWLRVHLRVREDDFCMVSLNHKDKIR